MKKMMTIAMCAAAAVAMAAEPAAPAPAAAPAAPAAQPAPAKKSGFLWRWWLTDADKDRDVNGCALGVASGCFKSVQGAQVNLLWGKAKEVKAGYQGAIGYCRADTLRNGCQAAVVTSADMAALQFGLICVNKEGFLPVFPFFNFSKKGFGKAK